MATGTISSQIVFNPFTVTASGRTGVAGRSVVGGITVPITTHKVVTYAVQARDAFSNPPQSILTVRNAAGFKPNQAIQLYRIGQAKQTVVIVSIAGNELTVKPKITGTVSGETIVGTGSIDGVSYDLTNPAIVASTLRVVISSKIQAFAYKFEPKISAPVVINCFATGVNVLYAIQGSLAKQVKITAAITGSTPLRMGAVKATIPVEAYLFGLSNPISGQITATPMVGIAATGLGYTLQGKINKPIKITANIAGRQRPVGKIATKVVVQSVSRGQSTSINSLYGRIKFGFKAFATAVPQTASGSIRIPISIAARGQTIDQTISRYGPLSAKVIIRANAEAALSVIGGTLGGPALVNILTGYTRFTTPIIQPIMGRSFMAPGVPTPIDFRYGNISASIVIKGSGSVSQYEGRTFGFADATIAITATARGTVRGYTGAVSSRVVIRGSLLDNIYGPNAAKVNVQGIVGLPAYSITVPKTGIGVLTITPPSNLVISKTVAYAVLGPEEIEVESGYQAVLFF